MPAVVLPRQSTIMEELGNILGAAANIPLQQQEAEKRRLEMEQLRQVQEFRRKVGEVLGMPSEITTPGQSIEIPGGLTDIESEGGAVNIPGETKPNVEREKKLKALKEIGPFYGVKQEKTLGETLQEIEARGEQGKKIEEAKQTGRRELQTERLKAKEIETKLKETNKNEAKKIDQELTRERNRISQQQADTAASRARIAQENVNSLVKARIAQADNYAERTKMITEQSGGDRALSAANRVVGTMQKQLTQISKIQENLDTSDPENRALLERAVNQYEASRRQLIELDPDAADEMGSLEVGEAGGITNMLKNMFGVGTPSAVVQPRKELTKPTPKKEKSEQPRINVPPSVRGAIPPRSSYTPTPGTGTIQDLINRSRQRQGQR